MPTESLTSSLARQALKAARTPVVRASLRRIPVFGHVLDAALLSDSTDQARLDAIKRGTFGPLFRFFLSRDTKAGVLAFRGIAKRLLDEPLATSGSQISLRQELARTPHLGCLQELALVDSSRLEYSAIWGAFALEIKESHDGLGLGSRVSAIDDSAKALTGGRITGLELVQTWILLTNWGHLFGTFATERALLYHLAVDHARRENLLDAVDPSLRYACEQIFVRRRAGKFFYICASVKASACTNAPLRAFMVRSLQLLLDERETSCSTHRWVFRKSRQLAMLRLHSMLGLGSVWGLADRDSLVRKLLPRQGIEGLPHEIPQPELSELLDAIQQYETRDFFANKKASALVLRHLREFREWWVTNEQRPVSDLVHQLSERPHDWPAGTRKMQAFSRIIVPSRAPDEEWFHEVSELRDKLYEGRWNKDSFMITPTSSSLLYDYFRPAESGPSKSIEVRSATVMLRRVAHHVERSWDVQDVASRRLWLSVAQFGLRAFDLMLPPGHRASLRPVPAMQGSLGLAILGTSAYRALGRARVFVERANDSQRATELEAVITLLSDSLRGLDQSAETPCLVFLGKVLIKHAKSGEEAHEIDGLVALFGADVHQWYAFECKKKGAHGGRGQLEGFGRLISRHRDPAYTLLTEKSTQQRALSLRFLYPAPLAPESAELGE